MLDRRQVMTMASLAGAAVATGLASAARSGAEPLAWRHFQTGEDGFLRAPVLLTSGADAVLIDGGFTLADGRALAEAIQRTGKTLKTIYVSQSDPDYYFGLGPVRSAFPSAAVLAAPETVQAIRGNVAKKLATWGPRLKDNGPQTMADVVFAEPSDARTLRVGGHTLEIVDASGLANRRYVWASSLDAIFGGVLVFGNLHVWTADTPSRAERQAWIATLEAMAARRPKVVVPGHMAPGAPLDATSIAFTRDYLLAFEEELARSADSAALIKAMQARFPTAGLGVSLEISAKVAKGEMKWS